jgi:ATP-binding cassette subfamily C protein LapB
MAGQLRGYDQVRSLLSSASVFALADLPFALLFVWVIYMLAGEVALVVLLSFTISIALAFVFARLIRRQADGVQIGTTRKNGLMVEVLDAAETIKANRAGWSMLARWNRLMALVEVDDFDMRRLSAIAQATSGTIQQIAYVGLISWGAIQVIDGKMTVGALIAASIIAGRVNGPLVLQLPAMIVQASYAKAALKGLDSFLRLPVDREPDVEYLRPEQLRSEVRLEKVAFMYQGARSGLAVEELKISPGERVGIIGPVGSGKSTLLKVMAGLFPPQSGVAYLSGLDLNQIAEDHLRRHVGYVGQEFRLVNGSLREQLTFGISDPGDDAILAAAEATGLNKLISAHPKGLELPISEGGRGVSGGQRALVGLTRLMLAKPKILLLDEPTAALDQETEEQALRAIVGNLDTNDALVMVTHKISLLNMVQRLIVVVNGKIIFDGPTAAVLQKLSPASANATAPVAANIQKVTI